jgi:hypothetical protein
MVPTSDSSFALQGVVASVEFVRDAAKKVTAAILVQNGARQRATRQAATAAAAAWTPSAADLTAMSGRYFSDELETFWEFVVVNGKLVARQRRSADMTLSPTAKDTFNGGAITVQLERDRIGQVIGFYVNVARSRDIRFERVR